MDHDFKIDTTIVGSGADCVLFTGMPEGANRPGRLQVAVTTDAGRALFGNGWRSPNGCHDDEAAWRRMEQSAARKYATVGPQSGYDVWLTSVDLIE